MGILCPALCCHGDIVSCIVLPWGYCVLYCVTMGILCHALCYHGDIVSCIVLLLGYCVMHCVAIGKLCNQIWLKMFSTKRK